MGTGVHTLKQRPFPTDTKANARHSPEVPMVYVNASAAELAELATLVARDLPTGR